MPVVHADESIDIVYIGGRFLPPRIELEIGAEIYFSNSADVPVWPASNIHPTHQIYPAFDPQQPIPPGGQWRFSPDQVGAWRFHNHLASDEGGMIVVLGDSTRTVWTEDVDPSSAVFAPLPATTAVQAQALFDDDGMLTEWVQRHGPAPVVHTLSTFGDSLGINCHERAHELGRIAYGLFGAGAFSLSGHECQSGSFHGATEALFRERGTANLVEDVSKICARAPNAFFRHNCIHGVGHGLMAWTSYALPEALALCDELDGSGPLDAASCFSGVFMENVVGGLSGDMGHFTKYLSDDPHYPCNALEQRYVKPCYGYQTTRMIRLFGGDFAKLSDACDAAPAFVHGHCFYSMGRDVGSTLSPDHFESNLACSHTKIEKNRVQCLLGVAQNALWEASGAPVASDFCKSLLKEPGKTRCWTTVMRRAKQVLTEPSTIAEFCDGVEPGYHFRRPLGKLVGDLNQAINPFSGPPSSDPTDELCYRPLPQWDRFVAWLKDEF